MPDADPRLGLLLSVADDELILGHRHSEWTGWAPHLEEDLAFSSIAQDEMAHARLLYELAGSSGLTDRSPDELALGRGPAEYRNAVICERPNGDWGYTVARQWLYDLADDVRTVALEASSWKELAEAMRPIRLEERYHLEHGDAWFGRMASGSSVTARERLTAGLEQAVGEAMAIFETLPDEDTLVRDGVLPSSNEELLAAWLERVGKALEEVSLDYVLTKHQRVGEMVPTSSGEAEDVKALDVPGVERRDGRWVHVGAFAGEGGRRGRHSDDFQALWEDLTMLYRKVPGATW